MCLTRAWGQWGISPCGDTQLLIIAPPPHPRVQRKIKSSENTVRTEVFVGHAVRSLINVAPKPGGQLIGAKKKITVRTEVFVENGGRGVKGRNGVVPQSLSGGRAPGWSPPGGGDVRRAE